MSEIKGRRKGRIFVFSGPSGAGKSTLCNMALAHFDNISFSISYTTRAPRAGETDGVEYRFVDEARFEEMIESGEFLEHAGVHGKRYGTAAGDIEEMTDSGIDALLDIDVQGAAQLMDRCRDGVYVFVLPPSIDACIDRLNERGDLKDEELKLRVRNAQEEIKCAKDYDYVIINDILDMSFEKLKAIVVAQRTSRCAVAAEVERLFGISID
ncbi:Guanylate kinase [hydrothermal vent metagenome]|uniref:guanylate kinase n=1 Tax=hydrothermal vent metagenome TaxID=652676 RepID=A0A3B0R1Y6_9ZZZZ